MKIRRMLPALLLAAALAPAQEVSEVKEAPAAPRTVDLAICLDTSGSMQGLINQARARIWAIVNDLALAKPTPRLRVALIAYGGATFDSNAGWVQVQTKFTEDLDLVSQKLFALHAKGSTEYVGRALQNALSFEWQTSPDALKLIVVAGNESADQDKQVPFRDMCRKSIARNIMVNSIYCGPETDNIAPGWREIARLSDGHFAAIDHNRAAAGVASPFDDRLSALSASLNTTYVWYGNEEGKRSKAKQEEADRDAKDMGDSVAAQRAGAKQSSLYYNRWCLVDATRRGKIKVEDLKPEDLPEELKGKSNEEIQKYLDAKFEERTKIQKQIADLQKQRQEWITKELAKQGDQQQKTIEEAVKQAIRAQAAKKGYKFEEE
jgi:hypothetical protein